jgi:hypothetical protein
MRLGVSRIRRHKEKKREKALAPFLLNALCEFFFPSSRRVMPDYEFGR